MAPKSSNGNLFFIDDITSPIDDDDEFGLKQTLSKPARRLRRKTQTKTIQKFFKQRLSIKNIYKYQIKLTLQKLKQNQIQKVKIDLTKINIKTLVTQIGVLSEDVKLFMKLVKTNRYYALNDRTINLLMKVRLICQLLLVVKYNIIQRVIRQLQRF